jgi:hypothetical protein
VTDAEWPKPADDPVPERGEDPVTHLLPNLERLRAMRRRQRRHLLHLVEDWIGPKVEEFRERVASL